MQTAIPSAKLGTIFFSILCLGFIISPHTASASVYKYIIEKELDYDNYLIKEYPFGNEYIIEKGIGCLSMWRYTYKPFYINQSGLLDGIGDTIILPETYSSQTCRIWNVKAISSPSYGALYPGLFSGISSSQGQSDVLSTPTATPKPKVITDKIPAADRKAKDFIMDKNVPVVVSTLFESIFKRKPSAEEGKYWKIRARSDKATESLLKAAMLYWFNKGRSPQANYFVNKNGKKVEMNGGYLDIVTNTFKK